MKERFSKNRMLLVIETRVRQCQKNWHTMFGSELTEATTYHTAELNGLHAIRLHERFNTNKALYYFIKYWAKQSEAFLDPEHVGVE